MAKLTFPALRDRDLSWLNETAGSWKAYAESLTEVRENVRTQVAGPMIGSSWKGTAAKAAGRSCDGLAALLESRQVRAAAIAGILADSYETISACQTRVRSTIRAAEAESMTVDDDGKVTPRDDDAAGKQAAQRYEEEQRIVHLRAKVVDDDTATAVDDLVPGSPGELANDEFADLSGDLREHLGLEKPPGGGPAANAGWWDSLSDAERLAYTYAYPEQVGAMDGLPAETRHTANMTQLRTDAASGEDQVNATALLDKIEKSQYGPEGSRIFLLGFDPPKDGADPNVIAAVGNPDTADHTACMYRAPTPTLNRYPITISPWRSTCKAKPPEWSEVRCPR